MLSGDQSARLERLQGRALKCVFGWNKSYAEVLELSGLQSLENRRRDLVDNFARKASRDPRFSHWFPPSPSTGHDTRKRPQYAIEACRTERYMNSPVFYMRRRLNDLAVGN